jgi:hypothetical protein
MVAGGGDVQTSRAAVAGTSVFARAALIAGAATVAVCCALAVSWSLLGGTPRLPLRRAGHGGLSVLPLSARGPVSRALGRSDPAYRVLDMHAANPAQRLKISFFPAGANISSGSGRVGLSLEGYGRPGALQRVAPTSPAAHANRVVYAHPGVEEWYSNGPLGLEQGYTVRSRPAGRGAIALVSHLTGTMRARLSGGTLLLTGDGASVKYSGLQARDARGRPLHAWLSLSGRRLTIRVDDRRAVYPLRIDPFVQQGGKLSGPNPGQQFGEDAALSGDGNTAVIGGYTGIYVFVRSGADWIEQARLTPTDELRQYGLGHNIAISSDGDTVIVGGLRREFELENGAEKATGNAWVFTRSGSAWTQQAELSPDQAQFDDFGVAVALSGDGNTAFVGDEEGATAARGTWIFTRAQSKWAAVQTLPYLGGTYGRSIALSRDGTTALIGGEKTPSVYVYALNGTVWEQQGEPLSPSQSGTEDFGYSVALSDAGDTALVSAPGPDGGTVWAFARSEAVWSQQGTPITGPGSGTYRYFGRSVSLSGNGESAMISEPGDEDERGAVWHATRNGSSWSVQGRALQPSDEIGKGFFGYVVSQSSNGETVLATAPDDGYEAERDPMNGAAWVFSSSIQTVTTEAASEISGSAATLNGSYRSRFGGSPSCRFEYGPTRSYGSSVPCSPSSRDLGEETTAVEARISDLSAGDTYHFRLLVEASSGESGPTYGADRSFLAQESKEELEEEESGLAEEEEQERLDSEGYGKFEIESYGSVSGILDVRNPPGTHLENLSDEAIEEAGLPAGSVAVVGGVSYSLQGLPAGTSVNAKLFLPAGSNPTNVFKRVDGKWVDETSLATISGNEITFHVTDGGPGDEDGVANGVIVDPMVPVRLQSPPAHPEVGRCKSAATTKEGAKTIYLGDYGDSKCSKGVPGTGKYEWKPGFEKVAFVLSGTKSSFETASKTKISCTSVTGTGEYTGATGESMRIIFSGCTNSSKAKCQSSGQTEGVIASSLLGGPIGYTEAAKGAVGVDLAPIATSEQDFADFQCAGSPERLTGSVIGQVKTVGKPSTAIELQLKAKKGVQSLQSLEGAASDTLSLTSGTAQPVAIGLTTKIKQTGEEPLEVKSKS